MRGLYKEYLSISDKSNSTCLITDKHHSRQQYIAYMLDRTSSMFEYDGLPDTIPPYMLELYLQIFGYAGFLSIDGSIQLDSTPHIDTQSGVHIFYGGIGGERDIYYRPKLFTVANPRLKNSIQATIVYPGDDYSKISTPCVIMPCDTNMMGLIPLFDRYAQQLTENDISIRSAQINARALLGISTSTDRDRESAKNFIQKLVDGEIAIMGESNFLDSMSVANVSTTASNTIIQLIELQQYLKASWYNELGLNVNFNMKREYMSEEEIAVNTDILLPLVDDMLRCRETYVELINKIFNLNISVHKSSAWANKEQEEISALSESAIKGQVPLKDTINNIIKMQKRLLGIVLVVISLMIVSCDWWWYYEYYVVNNYNEPVTFKFTRVDRYYKNKKDTTIIIKPLEKVMIASYFLEEAGYHDKAPSNPEDKDVPALWKYIHYITIGNDTIPSQRYNTQDKWGFEREGGNGYFTLYLNP